MSILKKMEVQNSSDEEKNQLLLKLTKNEEELKEKGKSFGMLEITIQKSLEGDEIRTHEKCGTFNSYEVYKYKDGKSLMYCNNCEKSYIENLKEKQQLKS